MVTARVSTALRAHGISPGTAGLAVTLLGLSVVGLVAPVGPYLGCSPGSSFPMRPWTLLTAGLFESNGVQAIFHAAALLACATVLEPLWGTTEWARFLIIADAAGSVSTMAASYLAFSATAAGPARALLLHTPRHGAAGLVAACLVGVAQAMPDREVTLAQVVKLRMKHVPGLYVGCVGVGAALVGRGLAISPLLFGGAAAGWVYLRFFQAREGGGRGDASAEFRLASFFPAPVTPVVDAMAEVCDRVKQTVVSSAKFGAGGADGLLGSGGAPVGGGKVDDTASQRRRERGQRALEERLKAKTGAALKPATDVEAVAV